MCEPPTRLIVNTTPLGMEAQGSFTLVYGTCIFQSSALVYDLVYNPAETLFLRQARAGGLTGSQWFRDAVWNRLPCHSLAGQAFTLRLISSRGFTGDTRMIKLSDRFTHLRDTFFLD